MSSKAPNTQREEALGMFGGTAGVLGSAVVDLLVFGFVPMLIAVRLVWGLAQLGVGFYLLRASPKGRSISVLSSSVVSSLGFLTIIALTGGRGSPYVIWLTGFSMALAPTSRAGTAISASILFVGTLAMSFGEPTWLAYAFSSLAAGGLAQYTAFLFHRARTNQATSSVLLAVSERRRQESERLVMLGQLAGGVAHEINNPLGCIKGNLSYLLEEEQGDLQLTGSERRQLLEETLFGVNRIASIVKDLRTFSSDEQPEVIAGELRPVVDAAMALGSPRLKEVDATLACSIDRDLPRVLVQHERLQRVLVSLLHNAADAVERRGERGHVSIRAEVIDSTIRLSVDDDGPGVAPELLERVFAPFFTTKPPGKGIGLSLALAREYLTRIGATITASNRPGGGARFSIELRAEALALAPAPGSGPVALVR